MSCCSSTICELPLYDWSYAAYAIDANTATIEMAPIFLRTLKPFQILGYPLFVLFHVVFDSSEFCFRDWLWGGCSTEYERKGRSSKAMALLNARLCFDAPNAVLNIV